MFLVGGDIQLNEITNVFLHLQHPEIIEIVGVYGLFHREIAYMCFSYLS